MRDLQMLCPAELSIQIYICGGLRTATDDAKEAAGQTQGDQRDASTTPARTHRGSGQMAQERADGALSVLCRATQHPGDGSLPALDGATLVSRAPTPEPEDPDRRTRNGPPDRSLAAPTSHLAPLPGSTPARDHPRQEPYAVIPPVRIRAGGGPKGPSLPQPRCALRGLV